MRLALRSDATIWYATYDAEPIGHARYPALKGSPVERPAAWHPDPSGTHDHRWWDGEQWTEHVADAGVSSVDPVSGTFPPPDPATGWVGGGQQAGGGQHAGTAGHAGGHDAPQSAAGGPGGPGGSGAYGQQGGAGPYGSSGAYGGSWQHGGPSHGGGWPPPSNVRDGMALAAMIVGILGLLISWIPVFGILGGLAGIVALVLGIIARKRIRTNRTQGDGMAITGIVTGVLSIVIAIAMTALFAVFAPQVMDATAVYTQCMEEINDPDECAQRMNRHIQQRLGGGGSAPAPVA